ncbi:MAG: hypothetical protein ACFE94_15805 [Candidatus Hodarchaeota archaeon]
MKLNKKLRTIILISLFINVISLVYLKDLRQPNINGSFMNFKIEIPEYSADLPTLINESSEFHLDTNIFIWDAVNFTFTYTNESGVPLTGLSNASYSWKQFNNLNETIDSGSGFLIETGNHHYVLDFETETRDVGTYEIIATFDKENYDSKNATVLLIIMKRVLEYSLSSNFKNNQISVAKGRVVPIGINLTDPTRGGIPVLNATIILTIGDSSYDFTETSNGTYILNYPTHMMTSNTLTGIITISKENYITEEFSITIQLKTTERIPGYSLFSLLSISFIVVIFLSKKLKKSI